MAEAEFFDIFGFIGFIYITMVSIWLLNNKSLPKWTKIILLAIGILGILVDGFIIVSTYLT